MPRCSVNYLLNEDKVFKKGCYTQQGKPMPTNVALTGLARDLAARADTGKPIRIGLVGAGEMGTDIVSRVAHMRGIEIGAISELNPQAAGRSVTIAYGDPDRAQASTTTDELNAVIESGRIATTNKVETLLESGLIDVVIDATGIPSFGAEIGLSHARARLFARRSEQGAGPGQRRGAVVIRRRPG